MVEALQRSIFSSKYNQYKTVIKLILVLIYEKTYGISIFIIDFTQRR